MNTLNSADHMISMDDLYGGSNRLFRKVVLPKNNIETTFVDLTDVSKVGGRDDFYVPSRCRMDTFFSLNIVEDGVAPQHEARLDRDADQPDAETRGHSGGCCTGPRGTKVSQKFH